jgi:hypothetical protein
VQRAIRFRLTLTELFFPTQMLHLVLLLWCLPLMPEDRQRADRLAQCSRPQAAVVRQLVQKVK